MHGMTFRMLLMGSAFACALATPGPAPAAEAEANNRERVLAPFLNPGWQLAPDRFDQFRLAQNLTSAKAASSPAASTPPDTPIAPPERFGKKQARSNYVLPAAEVVGVCRVHDRPP